MPEMADAGEDHGEVGAVGGGDHLVVAYRSAGLCDGGDTGARRLLDSVRKREEGIRPENGAACLLPGALGGDADRIDAVRLPHANPHGDVAAGAHELV